MGGTQNLPETFRLEDQQAGGALDQMKGTVKKSQIMRKRHLKILVWNSRKRSRLAIQM